MTRSATGAPSSKLALKQHPSAHLPQRRRRLSRCGRPNNRDFSGFAAGKSGGPSTPLLRWKLYDADLVLKAGKGRQKNAAADGGRASARRLAAGFWHLRLTDSPSQGSQCSGGRFEPTPQHLHFANAGSHNGAAMNKNDPISPASRHELKHGTCTMKISSALPNCGMERATKWDPVSLKTTTEAYRFYGHLNFLEEKQVETVSVVSALRAELDQARSKINELENERESAKRKLDHFLKRLAEEKASWRRREHEKVRNVLEAMKDDLNRERRNRQRIEIVNSKLVKELSEAKLSMNQYLQDYEKERKAKELMEEVCDELAKDIGEDKAEVEALKKESLKLREEVEEERRMLQMAEVWREERVQMKLVDAKLTLEEKYSQLSKLQVDIEAFLQTQDFTVDLSAFREAEALREAVNTIKLPDIKDYGYKPPSASEGIFSVFQELQAREMNEHEMEQCHGYSSISHTSNIHTASPDTDVFLEKPAKRYTKGTSIGDGNIEDESDWETVSQVNEQGSCNSPVESEPSVNGNYEESQASVSGRDWNENGDNGTVNSETSEVCSLTTKLSRKKGSSIVRLWRSSRPSNAGDRKNPVDLSNGRPPFCKMSNATLSPDMKSGEVGLSSPSVGQLSSPDSLNPHITKGIKGRIEWPRGAKKPSLKSKLLESRIESQKIQLRHVLKQKA